MHIFLRVALIGAAMVPMASAWAGTQTTVLRAPVTVVALGPSKAKLVINELDGSRVDGSRSVTIRRPVFVLAHPLRRANTRIY